MLLPPQPPSPRRYGRGCQGFPLCLPPRIPSGNDFKCGSSCSSIFHLSVSTQADSSSKLRKAARRGQEGTQNPVHTNLKQSYLYWPQNNLWEITGLHRLPELLFRNEEGERPRIVPAWSGGRQVRQRRRTFLIPSHCPSSPKQGRLTEEEEVLQMVGFHTEREGSFMTPYHSGAAALIRPRLAHPAKRVLPKIAQLGL